MPRSRKLHRPSLRLPVIGVLAALSLLVAILAPLVLAAQSSKLGERLGDPFACARVGVAAAHRTPQRYARHRSAQRVASPSRPSFYAPSPAMTRDAARSDKLRGRMSRSPRI